MEDQQFDEDEILSEMEMYLPESEEGGLLLSFVPSQADAVQSRPVVEWKNKLISSERPPVVEGGKHQRTQRFKTQVIKFEENLTSSELTMQHSLDDDIDLEPPPSFSSLDDFSSMNSDMLNDILSNNTILTNNTSLTQHTSNTILAQSPSITMPTQHSEHVINDKPQERSKLPPMSAFERINAIKMKYANLKSNQTQELSSKALSNNNSADVLSNKLSQLNSNLFVTNSPAQSPSSEKPSLRKQKTFELDNDSEVGEALQKPKLKKQDTFEILDDQQSDEEDQYKTMVLPNDLVNRYQTLVIKPKQHVEKPSVTLEHKQMFDGDLDLSQEIKYQTMLLNNKFKSKLLRDDRNFKKEGSFVISSSSEEQCNMFESFVIPQGKEFIPSHLDAQEHPPLISSSPLKCLPSLDMPNDIKLNTSFTLVNHNKLAIFDNNQLNKSFTVHKSPPCDDLSEANDAIEKTRNLLNESFPLDEISSEKTRFNESFTLNECSFKLRFYENESKTKLYNGVNHNNNFNSSYTITRNDDSDETNGNIISNETSPKHNMNASFTISQDTTREDKYTKERHDNVNSSYNESNYAVHENGYEDIHGTSIRDSQDVSVSSVSSNNNNSYKTFTRPKKQPNAVAGTGSKLQPYQNGTRKKSIMKPPSTNSDSTFTHQPAPQKAANLNETVTMNGRSKYSTITRPRSKLSYAGQAPPNASKSNLIKLKNCSSTESVKSNESYVISRPSTGPLYAKANIQSRKSIYKSTGALNMKLSRDISYAKSQSTESLSQVSVKSDKSSSDDGPVSSGIPRPSSGLLRPGFSRIPAPAAVASKIPASRPSMLQKYRKL